MFRSRPEKLTFLLGLYLSGSVILLSAGLLAWTHHTAFQAIDRELANSFEQRHLATETILFGRLSIMEHELREVASDDDLLAAIEIGELDAAAVRVAAIFDDRPESQLDIVVIRTNEGELMDCSVPFFDSAPLVQQIAGRHRELIATGRILRLQEGKANLTMMLKGARIIGKRNGRVLGSLIGGMVLDGNLPVMEQIRRETRSGSVAFLAGGKLIGSSDLMTDPATKTLARAGREVPAGEILRENGLLASHRRVRLSGMEGPLTIATAVLDLQFSELRRAYLEKGFFLLVFLVVFLFLTLYGIRRFTVVTLKRLTGYAAEVAGGNLAVRYDPGRIIEFNRIGEAMEEMVGQLSARNLQLEKSEQKFRAIFDQTFQLIGLLSRDGILLEANRTALEYAGVKETDVVGKPFWETAWWSHSRRLQDRLKRAVAAAAQGELVRFQAFQPGADGRRAHIDFSIKPFRDDKGRVVLLIPEGRDITELKKTQEKLERLNAELEERVRRRTEALESSLGNLRSAQKQLVESEKMASLGALVAGVAHEINTPVGIGVTNASFMADRCRTLEKQYASKAMTRSSFERFMEDTTQAAEATLLNLRKAAELINSFKQVAVDQTAEIRREFNIKRYLEEVLLSLAPEFRRSGHAVSVTGSSDIVLASFPGVFMQIITNLVMNSLTHGFDGIGEGNIVIELSAQGGGLLLRYSDDGKGMTAENKEKVFEPFFTTRRGQGGTGLGMHIVYNLVTQKLGGRIRCESAEGRGAVFLIRVPGCVSAASRRIAE